MSEVFRKGGRELIDLLEYCVISVKTDPVFVFLAHEYRMHPTAVGVVALFDMFCAADAPARISSHDVLPRKDLRLQQAIAPYRQYLESQHAMMTELKADVPNQLVRPPAPANYLFDFVVQELTQGPNGALMKIGQQYDPTLSPHENLSGGTMSGKQRAFVEQVWQPRVRPQLVRAGFLAHCQCGLNVIRGGHEEKRLKSHGANARDGLIARKSCHKRDRRE